jgi:hypothetical protein
MRYLCLLALIILVLLSPVKAQDAPSSLYYGTQDSIYRIVDGQSAPEQVVTDVSIPFFSNNGHWVAYHDDQGLWITELANWNPKRVFEDERRFWSVLSWTPDDTRFVFTVAAAVYVDGRIEGVDGYAYHTQTGRVESWVWSACDAAARHRVTHRVALICAAGRGIEPPDPAVVALEWGGDFAPYDETAFVPLVDPIDLRGSASPFDWQPTPAGDHFVYRGFDSDFRSRIYWVLGDSAIHSLDRLQADAPEQYLDVSPDRTKVAYDINCNYYAPRGCLIIVDLATGKVVRNFREAFYTSFVRDIDWYPDNRRVALLGQHEDLRTYSVWVADIVTGEVTEYNLGDSLGGIGGITIPTP